MGEKTKALASIALCVGSLHRDRAAVLRCWDLPAPWTAVTAVVAATFVIFAFSRRYRNSSFYDA